jgi:hypothetical protein
VPGTAGNEFLRKIRQCLQDLNERWNPWRKIAQLEKALEVERSTIVTVVCQEDSKQ